MKVKVGAYHHDIAGSDVERRDIEMTKHDIGSAL